MDRTITDQNQWDKVASDLEAENLKLMSYDQTLLTLSGEISGSAILDYGCGPGVLALALQKLGANIKAFDINQEMLNKAAAKIGESNVYRQLHQIPLGAFDIVICNLVLCIIEEPEVSAVLQNIRSLLRTEGRALVGFCNPKIFSVAESNLDFRFPTGDTYQTNHTYRKIKKEGGYEIIEIHRPIEWYEQQFSNSGMRLISRHFTPCYELKGIKIEDFAIFQLTA